MGDEVNQDERRTVPFADTLQKLQGGATARELGAALQELTSAVLETGRGGSLTLTIKVAKSKASGMVEVSDAWSVKAPKLERPVSMFFVTDDHNLVREDPRQLKLDLQPVRVVDAAPAPVAVVPAAAGGQS